jgi:prefoldin subunit 5
MQDIRDVLRNKEQQLEQLQREIEALRLSVQILEQEEQNIRLGPRAVEPVLKDNGARVPNAPLKQFR